MASNMSVNVLAPIRLRWALSFEKAISMGFRSGEYGGKNRNQHPASRIALAAEAFLWVARLSRMTTVPGTFWNRHFLDVSCKCGAVHRAPDHPGRDRGIGGKACNEGLRPP